MTNLSGVRSRHRTYRVPRLELLEPAVNLARQRQLALCATRLRAGAVAKGLAGAEDEVLRLLGGQIE